tara:strand:- start:268 stop:492 length:225 start_codon:yes stop_codon:yes gene_type:complete
MSYEKIIGYAVVILGGTGAFLRWVVVRYLKSKDAQVKALEEKCNRQSAALYLILTRMPEKLDKKTLSELDELMK